jgi:hypothetical protein
LRDNSRSLDLLFAEVQAFSGGGRRHDDITAIALKVSPDSLAVAPVSPANSSNAESIDVLQGTEPIC